MEKEKSEIDIMWDAIDFMKKKTINPKSSPLVDLTKYHWKKYKPEERAEFRRLLLMNNFISLNDANHWEFKLTAQSLTANKNDYDEKGNLKKDKSLRRELKIAAGGAAIGAIITAFLSPIPTLIQKLFPEKVKPQTIVLPKIQIVHDTIHIQKKH